MELKEQVQKEDLRLLEEITDMSRELIINKLRVNIELTAMADNKANVLLGLSSVIITFFLTAIIEHWDFIEESHLYIPIIIFVLGSLMTMFMAILVLRPGKIHGQTIKKEKQSLESPFYFGNTQIMDKSSFVTHLKNVVLDETKSIEFLVNDYYYVAYRLAQKMITIKKAFNIFLICTLLSVASTLFIAFFVL